MAYQHSRACDELTRDNTQSNLNAETVHKIPLALPPIAEQRAISDYLDTETARIDALISKKRRLIDLLAEHRTALITETVTKGLPPTAAKAAGLPPNPPLKPTTIPWLDPIPSHWQVRRIQHVAQYRTSSVDKKINEKELSVRLCNYTDVYYQDRIHAGSGDFMAATATRAEIARFRLRAGDVVITKDSEDWQDIGVPALIDETDDDFLCGYHLGIIRPGNSMHPEFLFRAMQSVGVNQQLQLSASGITRYGLPSAGVKTALIPIPPLDEQRLIAQFLAHHTNRIDTLTSLAQTAIDRLREYRTALITAAVTGKIDFPL